MVRMWLEGTVRGGRGHLLGSLAHALGLPKEKLTVMRGSAIHAADTNGTLASTGEAAAGVSPVAAQIWRGEAAAQQ